MRTDHNADEKHGDGNEKKKLLTEEKVWPFLYLAQNEFIVGGDHEDTPDAH